MNTENEKDKEPNDYKKILMFLETSFFSIKHLEEKIDCIMYILCKFDDEKIENSIRKYLNSDYKNCKHYKEF